MSARKILALAAAAPLAALPAIGLASPAFAQSGGSTTLQANLQPVPTNQVNASGIATVTVNGDQLNVTIHATGLDDTSPNGLPAHAQHIHIGGTHSCPTAADAKDHNGHQAISTPDAANDYGPIAVSLTTSGDTSPSSALALSRFPTTPAGPGHQETGTETYSRTITVSPQVAQEVAAGQGVVVIHGIDYLHNDNYKDLGKSPLDPSKPLEGTAPALCGQLVTSQMSTVPNGAPQTGGGSTSGLQDTGLLAGGAAGLVAAGGALAYRRRASAKR